MSPEKPTIIFREDWEPIGSKTFPEEVRIKARKNIEDSYKKIGITLNLEELTFIGI